MTLKEFAEAVGAGTYYIKQQMEAGEIPYEIKEIGKNFNYYIDPAFVPVYKEKVEQRKKSQAKGIRITRKEKRLSPLRRAAQNLEEYNKKNGLNLSYGQAVAKGIIEDK